MANVVVPFIFFLWLGAVTLVPLWLAARHRHAQLDVVREALVRGQTLDPRLLEGLNPPRDPRTSGRRNLAPGLLLTFLALGLAGSTLLGSAPPDASFGLLTAALVVGGVGVGFLLLAAFDFAAARKSGG